MATREVSNVSSGRSSACSPLSRRDLCVVVCSTGAALELCAPVGGEVMGDASEGALAGGVPCEPRLACTQGPGP
eukprot:4161847-Amphidinium_carterae.2